MAKIGYIMTAPSYEDFSADSGWMENFGCVEIVREELLSGDKARTQWDSLMARIRFGDTVDRKSTRLNSSHANISYAVFCLKKKRHARLLRSSLVSSTLPLP